MKERGKIIKMLLYVCVAAGFLFGAAVLPVYGAGDSAPQETIIDQRDIYLDLEAVHGAEGLPYEYMTPKEEHVKTKIDLRDIYLDMEAIHGAEGLPYKNQISPEAYVPVKHDPQALKLDIGKMVTDDPSFVKGQENY